MHTMQWEAINLNRPHLSVGHFIGYIDKWIGGLRFTTDKERGLYCTLVQGYCMCIKNVEEGEGGGG